MNARSTKVGLGDKKEGVNITDLYADLLLLTLKFFHEVVLLQN